MLRKFSCALIVAVLLLSSLGSIPSVVADYVEGEKSGTGTVVVGNVAPIIYSMAIREVGDSTNFTAVDPWTLYTFQVTAGDNNQLQDIVNVTITLTSATGVAGVFDETASYGFQYDNTSGTPMWRELTATGWSTSYTYLDDAQSAWPTNSLIGSWNFTLKLYKTAHYEATWTLRGDVEDQNGLSGTKTNGFGVNRYISFTVPTTVMWSTIQPPVQNVSAQAMPALITVTANDVVAIQIRGSGDLTTTPPGGTIPLSNVYVGQTSNAAANDGVTLSTDYQDLYTSLASPDNTAYDTYWFITVDDGTQPGTYTFTYYIQVL